MRSNQILKFLCSIPSIILIGYFIPFVGVCLIIMRYFGYHTRNKKQTPLYLALIGIIILLPQGIVKILEILNQRKGFISYLNMIVKSDIYLNFFHYAKFLICVAVIFLLISVILNHLFGKSLTYIKNYINQRERRDYEISKENNLRIKERQERAKNTKIVYCPFCGADNILTETVEKCKYCRKTIS